MSDIVTQEQIETLANQLSVFRQMAKDDPSDFGMENFVSRFAKWLEILSTKEPGYIIGMAPSVDIITGNVNKYGKYTQEERNRISNVGAQIQAVVEAAESKLFYILGEPIKKTTAYVAGVGVVAVGGLLWFLLRKPAAKTNPSKRRRKH